MHALYKLVYYKLYDLLYNVCAHVCMYMHQLHVMCILMYSLLYMHND